MYQKQKKCKTNKKYFAKKIVLFSLIFFCYTSQNSFAKSNNCYCYARRNSPCACPDYDCYLRRCNDVCHYGKTFLQPRSQNTNTARRAVGHHRLRHQFNFCNPCNSCDPCNTCDPCNICDTCDTCFRASFAVTPEYSQSFKPYHIAEYFFGTDCLDFTGGEVEKRSCNDILGDYFGLSPTFEGTVRFEPLIKSFLLDFDLLLEFKRGVYMRIYTPLVRTKSQMRMCESIEERGLNTPFPPDYMAEEAVKPPVAGISKALGGGVTFGHVTEGIRCGKFCCEQTTTKLADITFLLGWIFLQRERGYVGVNGQFTVPTGTRPKNNYIFEPVAGNGHHWEFGIGFTGEVLIWEKDGEQTLHLHFDTNFSHLFKTCQCRSFDLKCNRFASRYMLAKEFDRNGAYTQKLTPVINFTTLKCDVKINFQMDLNIMFAYNYNDWEFDFGYNGWLRSHEKICLQERIPEKRYGLKGILDVAGDLNEESTQSRATIYGNPYTKADEIPPVFIRNCDIDICSAETPKALTHKFYWHLSHAWEEEDRCTTPYLGGGAHIEFESVNPRFRCPYKNAIYQWALWLKCGFAYS